MWFICKHTYPTLKKTCCWYRRRDEIFFWEKEKRKKRKDLLMTIKMQGNYKNLWKYHYYQGNSFLFLITFVVSTFFCFVLFFCFWGEKVLIVLLFFIIFFFCIIQLYYFTDSDFLNVTKVLKVTIYKNTIGVKIGHHRCENFFSVWFNFKGLPLPLRLINTMERFIVFTRYFSDDFTLHRSD